MARKRRNLLTRKQLAAELGVHPQTIVNWQQDGCPIAKPGSKGVPHRYDPEEVQAWKAARDEAPESDEVISLERERARKERALALINEQKFATLSGQLLEAGEVKRAWSTHINAVKAKLRGWPSTLADRLYRAAHDGSVEAVEVELAAAVDEVLEELAQGDLELEPPATPGRRRRARKAKAKK